MTVIRVDDVYKSYGTVQAVDGMDFAVERGSCSAFWDRTGPGRRRRFVH